MTDHDTWGMDPQIRYMRKIFAAVEAAQKGFLETAGISPTDERLKRLREVALAFFERSWMAAMQRGAGADEDCAVPIYIFCLARALSMKGVDVPPAALPDNEVLRKLVDEVLR